MTNQKDSDLAEQLAYRERQALRDEAQRKAQRQFELKVEVATEELRALDAKKQVVLDRVNAFGTQNGNWVTHYRWYSSNGLYALIVETVFLNARPARTVASWHLADSK